MSKDFFHALKEIRPFSQGRGRRWHRNEMRNDTLALTDLDFIPLTQEMLNPREMIPEITNSGRFQVFHCDAL